MRINPNITKGRKQKRKATLVYQEGGKTIIQFITLYNYFYETTEYSWNEKLTVYYYEGNRGKMKSKQFTKQNNVLLANGWQKIVDTFDNEYLYIVNNNMLPRLEKKLKYIIITHKYN